MHLTRVRKLIFSLGPILTFLRTLVGFLSVIVCCRFIQGYMASVSYNFFLSYTEAITIILIWFYTDFFLQKYISARLSELHFYNFQFLSVSTDHNICNPLDHKLFAHDELNLSTVVIQVYLT